MVNTKHAAFLLSGAVLLSSAAYAEGNGRAHVGFDVSPDAYFIDAGGSVPLDRDTSGNGWGLRANAGYGQYSYSRPGSNIDVDTTRESILLGYRKLFGGPNKGYMVGSLGGDYQNHSLNKTDTLNPVRGDKFGVMGQLFMGMRLDDKTFVDASGSYSTAFDTYGSDFRFGYNLAHCSIGPEVSFSGNEAFDQQRIGGFIGDIVIADNVIATGGAGFSRTNRLIDEDGAYGDIMLIFQF